MNNMKIIREDVSPTCARFVRHGGMAYFTDHVAKGDSLKEQTENLLATYDRLFAKFNLKKKNLVGAVVYFSDIIKYREEFLPAWEQWCGDNPPVLTAAQAGLLSDEYQLSMALTVAEDDESNKESCE